MTLCSFVSSFPYVNRDQIVAHKLYTLEATFESTECLRHGMLAVESTALKINSPWLLPVAPVLLSKTGLDCCECATLEFELWRLASRLPTLLATFPSSLSMKATRSASWATPASTWTSRRRDRQRRRCFRTRLTDYATNDNSTRPARRASSWRKSGPFNLA